MRRDVVGLVSRRIALRYATYAASGSTAWDATIDVHRRPAWLKRLAGVAPDQRELPRGVSKLATRAGVHDAVLAAYRSASRDAHPDKEGGSQAKFTAVARAYEVLGDDRRRADYDAGLDLPGERAQGFTLAEEPRTHYFPELRCGAASSLVFLRV